MLKKLVLAAAAAGCMGSTAMAADLMQPPPMSDPVVSGWDGFYAGLTGALWFQGTVYPGVGVRVGGNYTSGDFLIGLQSDLRYYPTSGNLGLELAARGGVILNDTAVVYGKLGVGGLSNGSRYIPIGVGVEFKVSDSVSVDLSADYLAGSGFSATQVGASLNWHF